MNVKDQGSRIRKKMDFLVMMQTVWEAMSCQRLVNAHVFNKEIHSGMRFPAPSKKGK